jgi:hypothetical protein
MEKNKITLSCKYLKFLKSNKIKIQYVLNSFKELPEARGFIERFSVTSVLFIPNAPGHVYDRTDWNI